MDIQNIPWQTIEAKLVAGRHNQAWLARELNIGTNVVANWRSRGGAPMARAAELARLFGCSLDEFLTAPERTPKNTRPTDRPSAIDKARQSALITAFEALSDESRRDLERYAAYLAARDRGAA